MTLAGKPAGKGTGAARAAAKRSLSMLSLAKSSYMGSVRVGVDEAAPAAAAAAGIAPPAASAPR